MSLACTAEARMPKRYRTRDGAWGVISRESMPQSACRVMGLFYHPLARTRSRCSTAPHSRQKVVRGFLGGVVSRKNPQKCTYFSGKKGRFCQKSNSDACEGWSKKASPPTQLDLILCKVPPVAARPCAIAFLTLDGALSTVCKRWYPDRDIAVEERPAATSSPASLCSRLSTP
jgi:hypothetical protein